LADWLPQIVTRRNAAMQVGEETLGHAYEVLLEGVTYHPSDGDGRAVLDNVTLRVGSGEFVAIIGGNAAGKTTLLRAIAGELRGCAGRVTVGGEMVDRPIRRLIDGVGVVHQFEEADLVFELTVGQNIAIRQLLGGGHGTRFWAMPQAWQTRVRAELASKAPPAAVPLGSVVGRLSGGKRQMLNVAIGMFLEHSANPCRLLLLDEHTSRLDWHNARQVMDLTVGAVRATRTTTVMITHKYADALASCDRIILMHDGRVIDDMKTPFSLDAVALEQHMMRKIEECER
jgi:putative ABC transport system ATP-binding protein